ncbi:Hypothetical protein CINCED_3A021327 [Cinara cedri]|uniref:Uncharacterized protein n=1 Tax=Cinara cedri TaxID=506608 RepID=A0A5E4M263_9HEMI|nr:Hypothetical protein CINCED_3A021327 [Cinara cedri]
MKSTQVQWLKQRQNSVMPSRLCNVNTNAEIPHKLVIINVAKYDNITSELIGTVETNNVVFNDVTYVLELRSNVLSDNKMLIQGYKNSNGLYVVNIEASRNTKEAFTTGTMEYWHKGHRLISFNNLKKIPHLCYCVPEIIKKCKSELKW